MVPRVRIALLLSAFALAVPAAALSQSASNAELEAEILAMDAQLFDRGFNQCDLAATESAISDDLEFYHDLAGIQDRAAFMVATRENICGNNEIKPIRRLVPDTNEVFPLYNDGELYGAIQRGDHNFYHRRRDGVETLAGSAAFTHLWMLEDGAWRLLRVLSFAHSGADELPPPFRAGYRSPLFDNDAHIEALMERHNIPSMALARINGGHLQQVRVFGELAGGRPAPVDTLYKVASLTKPITAMLTLKLVEAGLWDLDAPLSRFYIDPDIAGAPELARLTTRHVLSHRTGFPNWRYLTDSGVLRFEFEPGSRQQYSGEGFEYLRRALEAHFERPIEDLAREYLFDPLGMENTHFTWTDDLSHENYAKPHDAEGEPIDEERHREANAAANLLTTAEDYARFMVHILQGAGLSEELYAQMVTPSPDNTDDVPFGLGWAVVNDLPGGRYALQHTGGDPGVKTVALLFPESGDGLLVLSNSENGMVLWPKIVNESFGAIGEALTARNLAQ